jgi:hypothetical protein
LILSQRRRARVVQIKVLFHLYQSLASARKTPSSGGGHLLHGGFDVVSPVFRGVMLLKMDV